MMSATDVLFQVTSTFCQRPFCGMDSQ